MTTAVRFCGRSRESVNFSRWSKGDWASPAGRWPPVSVSSSIRMICRCPARKPRDPTATRSPISACTAESVWYQTACALDSRPASSIRTVTVT